MLSLTIYLACSVESALNVGRRDFQMSPESVTTVVASVHVMKRFFSGRESVTPDSCFGPTLHPEKERELNVRVGVASEREREMAALFALESVHSHEVNATVEKEREFCEEEKVRSKIGVEVDVREVN